MESLFKANRLTCVLGRPVLPQGAGGTVFFVAVQCCGEIKLDWRKDLFMKSFMWCGNTFIACVWKLLFINNVCSVRQLFFNLWLAGAKRRSWHDFWLGAIDWIWFNPRIIRIMNYASYSLINDSSFLINEFLTIFYTFIILLANRLSADDISRSAADVLMWSKND